MKIYIISSVPAQIPYLGKLFFLEIYAKMLSANQIAEFSNQLFLQDKLMKDPHFLHVDTNLQKIKVDQKFWLHMIKIGSGQSGFGTLKLQAARNPQKRKGDRTFFEWASVWSWDSKIDCISK